MSRPRTKNKHLPKYVTVIHGSYWYRPPKAKPQRLAAVGEESEMYRKMADLVREVPQKEGNTLADYFDRYEREIVPTLAPRTQKDYRRHLKKLKEEFGSLHPDELRPRDVGRFLDVPTGKIHRVRIVAVLSAVYSKMVGRWYVAEKNPCRDVERHKNPPRTRYINDEEFHIIREIMPPRHQIAMDLAYLTGQRQGDILSLKWADVLEDGVTFRQSKTGQGRHVLLSDELRAVLTRAKQMLPFWPREYVIRTMPRRKKIDGKVQLVGGGKRYTSEGFRSVWQRFMRKAMEQGLIKERFRFHDIRAKTVSDEEDVDQAQLRAGHTSKQMTLRVYSRKVRRVPALK